jgi:hypothetical protein
MSEYAETGNSRASLREHGMIHFHVHDLLLTTFGKGRAFLLKRRDEVYA